MSRLNESCFFDFCVTYLKPNQYAYLFFYHPGDTGNITETVIVTYMNAFRQVVAAASLVLLTMTAWLI